MIDYNRIAAEYDQHRQVHPAVLRDLIATGAVGPSSRLLELGCGTGRYVTALQAATCCSAWGIDPSEQMLARARDLSSAISWRLGSAERLDFADASLDMVFSVDVIHHVSDRPAYYCEAHRVLRPGGKLCTVTDSESIIRTRQPLSIYFPETVEVELKRYPPTANLRNLMEQVGFTDIAETTAEFPYLLTDSQAYRDRAFSSLHLIPDEAFQRGLARLVEDLRAGPIPCVSRYVLLWGTRSSPNAK